MVDGAVPYGDGEVAYRDVGGPGPSVLLLHGVGGNLAHWGRVAPLLAHRYRLVAVDLPSHGASTAPAAYSLAHDIGAVDEVRRALELDRPAVVGHSYGGMLAVFLAATRPDSCRAVVNVDGLPVVPGFEREPDPYADQAPAGPSVAEGDDAWLEGEITREVEEAAAVGLHLDRDGEMVRRAFQRRADGRWHSSPSIDRFIDVVRSLDSLQLLPACAATSCRTVTVIAEQRHAADDVAAAAERRRLDAVRTALVAAGSEVDTLPSGHYPHVEMPELVAERLPGWIDG